MSRGSIGGYVSIADSQASETETSPRALVGTANATAMASVEAYEGRLTGTRVTVALLDGLTHQQELDMIDRSLPRALEFTRAHR